MSAQTATATAPAPDGEAAYLALVAKILADGEPRATRNATTFSVFGERLAFDLRKGFPLLTTKRIYTRAVVEELLWFLRGHTDARLLAEKGVHIWDGNTTREFLDAQGLTDYPAGECGPIYGFQWRAFGGAYPSRDGGVDQIRYVLNELAHNPGSRRILFSGWNPQQMSKMTLPPCHILYQFYLSERDGLSCQMVARSQDVMLGTPFNIASTALLTHLFAAVLHVPVKEVILIAGDAHIYDAHVAGAETQLARSPMAALPRLNIRREPPAREASVDEKILWLETLSNDDVEFVGYECHPAIRMPMIA
jgi:thymidylate synthase